ncbi:MAG: hypothetical protein BGO07_01980 [Alphaproteobacteria bacterium 40-19]|nr:MAG: hypothetical protein BGO07_01980 [Alphaproteobacteria bacterium 40-19]
MKKFGWILSALVHVGFVGMFWWMNQSGPVAPAQITMPCTVPMEVTTFSKESEAPISKPKVDDPAEQKRSTGVVEDVLPKEEPVQKEKKKPKEPVEKKEEPKNPPVPKSEEKDLKDILDELEKKHEQKEEKKNDPKKIEPSKNSKKDKKKKKTAKHSGVPIEGDGDEDLMKILKDYENKKKGPSAQTPVTDPDSSSPYGAGKVGKGLAVSIIDRVRQLLQRAWRLPPVAENGEELVVIVRLSMNPDGTVANAKVVGGTRTHPAFAVAAESALAAAYDPTCNPLPLPLDLYEQWQVMTVHFAHNVP